MNRRAALVIVSALVAAFATGCGSSTKNETTPATTPPPEAMRPSPVDREAEPAPAMFDWTHHVGVAGHASRGRAVVAIKDDALAVGSPLTIVWMTDPQQASEARILGRRSKPWSVANTPVDGTAYDVEVTEAPQSNEYGIAVVSPKAPEAGGPLVHIDLDGDGEPETFRQCSSAEGLHLTVWTGEPLKGPLDWQAYVYLGMDLEVTCTETETGQP